MNPWQGGLVIDEAIDRTAPALARTILATSILCARRIEEAFRTRGTEPGKFKDPDFQDIVTEFVHVLIHLSDREAFEKIPDPQKRSAFLNSLVNSILQLGTTQRMTDEHPVPAFTRMVEPGIQVEGFGMDRLNKRQAEYAGLKLFAAQGE
jgi:hypothetical protein